MGDGMTAEASQHSKRMMGQQGVERAPGSAQGTPKSGRGGGRSSSNAAGAVIVGGGGRGSGPPPPPHHPPAAAPWSSVVATTSTASASGVLEPPISSRLCPPPAEDGLMFFSSPRSTAAVALSSFSSSTSSSSGPQGHEEPYRRDFSPPPAFDPPRATMLRASSTRHRTATEIHPTSSSSTSWQHPRHLHHHHPNHLLQGPTPSFPPPYFTVSVPPPWQQQQQQQPPPPSRHPPTHLQPFPMPPSMPAANAWQQQQQQSQQHLLGFMGEPASQPLSLSSTSLLPDPRVSALSTAYPSPQHPSLGSNKKPRSSTAPSASRSSSKQPPHMVVMPSQPLQAMSQNPPYYSHSRPRPPPHTFVTPTPKKLRLLPADPLSAAAAGRGIDPSLPMTLPPLPYPPPPHHPYARVVGAKSTLPGGNGTDVAAAAIPNPSYSRKTKSLGVLAENFCQIFASRPPYTEIIVDSVSSDLGVERRRIYDVVNILESIRVVVKKAKNTYCWMGSGHLPFMFALLQREAFDIFPDDAIRHGLLRAPPGVDPAAVAEASVAAAKVKDTRSLCRLSQHFLEVFLAGNVEISLPDASDKIHGETTVKQLAAMGSRGREPVDIFDAKKFQQAAARGLKTKIRRLYDIANVFIALGILTKLENTGVRSNNDRPTFRWTFNASAADVLRVYETMPEHMKQQQTPFPNKTIALSHFRRDVAAAPVRLSWPDEGPELFPPASGDEMEPLRLLPPQPSPTSSEEADGFLHGPLDELPPEPSSAPPKSATPSSGSDSEPRRISLPLPREAQLE